MAELAPGGQRRDMGLKDSVVVITGTASGIARAAVAAAMAWSRPPA